MATARNAGEPPTLSAADALQHRLVSELELSASGNELELVVDGISILLLQNND